MTLRVAIALCLMAMLLGTSVRADTVAPAYLNALEAQIVEEVNLARTQPERYAELIEQTRSEFQGRFRVREGRLPVRTEEGLSAVEEAIAYLRRAKPLKPLVPSPGMSRAAQDHADDQSRTGETGHEGSDGSEAPQRMARYGRWLERAGENIAYGYGDARETVMQLIIDDGYPSRGHRKNFFTPEFRRIGVGCASHRKYRRMCTMTLAGGYLEAGEAATHGAPAPVPPAQDGWRFDDLWQAIMHRLDERPEPAQTRPDSKSR